MKPWWQQWWALVLGGLLVLGLISAAINGLSDDAASDTEDEAAPIESEDVGAEGTTSPTTTTVALDENPQGSRQNPIPMGERAVFTAQALGDADGSVWALTVDGPGRDITSDVADSNMFNPEPASGHFFLGVPISLELMDAEKEPLSTQWNLEFEIMGKTTLTLRGSGFFECGEFDTFDTSAEVFIGGTLSGLLCIEVPMDDYDAGFLLTLDRIEEGRVFLDAGSPRDAAPSGGPSPTTTSPESSDDSTDGLSERETTVPETTASETTIEETPADLPPGGFIWESRLGGDRWEGQILGHIYSSPNSLSDDGVQQCIVVIGTTTPLDAGTFGLTSGTSPDFSLFVDGRLVESSLFGCDTDAATDNGYEAIVLDRFTAGSVIPFHRAFELPANVTDPDTVEVILGDTDDDDYQRIPTSYLEQISPGTFVGQPLPRDGVLPAGTVVNHDGGDSKWDVVVEGVAQLNANQNTGASKCVVVFGTMTPTDTGGALVADGSDTPFIGVVAGGRAVSAGWTDCDDEAAARAGYEDPKDADIGVGAVYHFYTSIVVPSGDPLVEAVTVGSGFFEAIRLVDAPLLDALPLVGE